jgi:hypothetical protein
MPALERRERYALRASTAHAPTLAGCRTLRVERARVEQRADAHSVHSVDT